MELLAIASILSAGLVLYVIWNLGRTTTVTHQEPAIIHQRIPFVGHLIGLLRNGTRYFSDVNAKLGLPIYTLPIPGSRLYIVRSPELVTSIEKNPDLDFAPHLIHFARTILIPSSSAIEALEYNIDGKAGSIGCRIATQKTMQTSIAPGPNLTPVQGIIRSSILSQLEISDLTHRASPIRMFEWTRHLVTLATTRAIYGKENPFENIKVENALWTVDEGFGALLTNILPSIFASRAHKARQVLFDYFAQYYKRDGLDGASQLIKSRYEVNREHGVSIADIAHFELSVPIALLVNTAPAVFWTLYFVYSDEVLLRDLRKSFDTLANSTASNEKTGAWKTLKMEDVTESCPLMISTIQEVLRFQATNANARGVLHDTVLDGKYRLRKGGTVFIPANEQHLNQNIWGLNAGRFDTRRFLIKEKNGEKAKRPTNGYRAFGGGSTLCPGRFLAISEIAYVVAFMASQLDLVPINNH
ncbi:Cytochrome P450 [Glarea lozoyensis ATCC 20868]|uniref:Cytochrome P450 n=1 Tax=Glarea lozoyensis (strain ATCC 20868 / MF5171) TaxID=1116229 RepID=S3DHK7_GLAL2|nr:Cytochrome P450 [Glarea lozoyensis ATCC 20868]EPE37170.1 Cytochrome P450 [Glarea lozoyensis ATCC 20868]